MQQKQKSEVSDMKPKRLLFYVAVVGLSLMGMNAKAQTPLDIKLNGSYIKTASQGFIEEGSAMVPVRCISEAFGCDEIKWNEKERAVSVEENGENLVFYIDKDKALVNGKWEKMPNEAKIVDGRTYVGVRFLSDFFDADVNWNGLTHTVELSKKGFTPKNEHIDDSYTSADLEWLAKIVHAEAGGEPNKGKIAVGNVVMNRIESNDFPDTVYDVVFDRKYGVQFTPVANGAIYNNPSRDSYHSAKKALFGENVVGKSLYFCNTAISTNFWIVNNRPFFTQIGKHSFYL